MPLTKVQSQLLGTGTVLQVVQGVFQTQTSMTSDTFINSGLSASITPSSSSSKILVIISMQGIYANGSNTFTQMQLTRSGTSVSIFDNIAGYNTNGGNGSSCTHCYLDSPASTSAVPYVVQIRRANGAATIVYCNQMTVAAMSTITLMEIAG